MTAASILKQVRELPHGLTAMGLYDSMEKGFSGLVIGILAFPDGILGAPLWANRYLP